jgi:ABC-2 type transport system ATP-binding protein
MRISAQTAYNVHLFDARAACGPTGCAGRPTPTRRGLAVIPGTEAHCMTGNHTACVKAVQLSKSYGPIEALREVSFEISKGEIVGLLGPNGAGKTTMLKILTGYLQPDEGSVWVDGLDVLTHPKEIQSRIGYLPENAPLYPELSVQAYLRMMADLRRIPGDQQLFRISEAVYATGLAEPRPGGSDQLARPIGELSKGYRQRVGLAQAILHQPTLLILDEPTVGLDPTQIVEVRRLIRRLADRATVLFSTHVLSEVEALCDRVIILINGEVKTDARLADLETTADAILVLGRDESSRVLSGSVERSLRTLSGVRGIEPIRIPEDYPAYRVLGMGDVDLCPAIYDLARDGGWPLRELRRDTRTLETVFNRLATGA